MCAKIKMGAFVTDIRNKVGGTVFSKNRGGAYTKNKVSPAQPNTSYQTTARTRMTTYSQGWRSLTTAQQAAWNAAVNNFQGTDVFGDIKTPSGQNLYGKLNINIAQAGGTAITSPPLPAAVVGPTTITLTAAAGTPAMSLAWTGGAVPASTTWLIEMTGQLSAGRFSVKSMYRIVTTAAAAATTPANLLTAYNTKFGTLVAGTKIFVKVTPIGTTTGIKGTALTTSCIVAA